MKIGVWIFSALLHIFAALVILESDSVNAGSKQTATGLRSSVEVTAARLITTFPRPEPVLQPSSEVKQNDKLQQEQPTTDTLKAKEPHVTESVVAAESDVVGDTVVPQQPEPKASVPKQKTEPEIVKKPVEQAKPIEATKSKPKVVPPKTSPVIAQNQPVKPDSEVAESPQNARQASLGQQGDNSPKASIVGESEPEHRAWNQYKASVFAAINAQKVYPKQAKIRRIEGIVTVRFVVNEQGLISRYEIIKKAKSRYLNRSTKELFAGLRLPQPAASLSEHLPSTLTVPIKYSLN